MFLRKENEKNMSKVSVLHKSPEQIQAEWDECVAKNEQWNAEVAQIRAVRLEKEAEEQREYVLQKLTEKEQRMEEWRGKIRATIEEQKKQMDTFITEENIDKAIEHALANPSDYNFAIDLDGNLYRGREGVEPEPVYRQHQ